MFERKYKLMLNNKLDELKMNLENNYKDLAHRALDDFFAILEQLRSNGSISEKTYAKYLKTGEMYRENMRDYHH